MKSKTLNLIALSVGINGLIISGPLLVTYVLTIGASVENIGTLISTLIFSSVIGSFFGSTLGDIFGSKKVILIVLFMVFTSNFLLIFTTSWIQVLPLLVISGCAMGTYNPILNSLIASLSESKERGRAFGNVQAIRRGSQMIGPIIAGILAKSYGYKVMWLGVSSTTFISLIVFSFVRYLPQKSSKIKNFTDILRESFKMIKDNMKDNKARILLTTAFLTSLAISLIETYVPVRARNIGANPAQIGLLGGVVGATFVFNYFGGHLADRFKEKRRKIYFISLLMLIRSFTIIVIPFITGINFLIFIWFLIFSYDALGNPAWNTLSSEIISKEKLGTFFGASFTIGALGYVAGPQLGGIIWGLTSEFILYLSSIAVELFGMLLFLLLLPKALKAISTQE